MDPEDQATEPGSAADPPLPEPEREGDEETVPEAEPVHQVDGMPGLGTAIEN